MAYDTDHLLTVGHAKQIHDNLKSAISDNTRGTIDHGMALMSEGYFNVEGGSISSSDGSDTSSNTRCRTKGYISIDDFLCVDLLPDPNYKLLVFCYNSGKTFLEKFPSNFTNMRVDRTELLVNYPTAKYIRFAFSRTDGGNISSLDTCIVPNYIYLKTNSVSYADNALRTTYYKNIAVGTIDSSGNNATNAARARTVGYIGIDDFVMIDLMKKSTSYTALVFCYDSSKTFISRMDDAFHMLRITRAAVLQAVPTTAYIRIIFKTLTNGVNITPTHLNDLKDVLSISPSYIQNAEEKRVKARFDKQFNYVANSGLTATANDAPANTAEHFVNCANDGKFTALKGDVRPTVDGGVIMCHDAGYTFDGNGKITTYNASDSTDIDTLTVAECTALTFADQFDGQDCHPIDFETYVRICKKYGLIAYVTVRDEQIASVVAPVVMSVLTKYRMLDNCIINSFTKESLETFRALNDTIMLSMVLPHNQAPTTDDVDYVLTLGNCNLNLFDNPTPSGYTLDQVLTSYADVLEYAYANNVLVYEAQTGNASTDVMMQHGIMGSHMYIFPDYDYQA